jgi:hypothetical protein
VSGNRGGQQQKHHAQQCLYACSGKQSNHKCAKEYATGSQGDAFGGRLQAVIYVRHTYQADTPEYIEYYPDDNKYFPYKLIHQILFLPDILPGPRLR